MKLTTDERCGLASQELFKPKTDFDQLDSRLVGTEFVGTSISSGGDGSPQLQSAEQLRGANPFVKFYNAQRGYVRCDITPARWQTDYRVVEKSPPRALPSRPGNHSPLSPVIPSCSLDADERRWRTGDTNFDTNFAN